jgi:inward rectifier potassium channel
MGLSKKINWKAATDENTGFGTNGANYGGRLFRRDGIPNVRKTGISWLERNSWYHTMLQISRWKFLFLIFAAYTVVNLFFAFVYLFIGVDKLAGIAVSTPWEKFGEAFFFSAQTFTTVGYGRLSPTGWLMSFTASSEALIGLLSFAVATGLMYGRFSRPRAFIKFSNCALIAPYQEGIALMLRFAPYKNNHLTEAETKLTLAMTVEEGGQSKNRFFPLKLELDRVNALTLNWTVVHVIDETSPFYGLSDEDLQSARAEVLVFVKGFDESFSNMVVARGSYRVKEFVFGAKFKPMYYRDDRRDTTVLNIDLLDAYEEKDVSYSTMMKLPGNRERRTPASV